MRLKADGYYKAIDQLLLGVEDSLKPSTEVDWVPLWDIVHDIVSRFDPGIDSTNLRRIFTLVIPRVQQEIDSSGTPGLRKAIAYHHVLYDGVQLMKDVPDCLPGALLEDLETRCLGTFNGTMEGLGCVLTDWDQLAGVPSESLSGHGLAGDFDEVWRVKQLRISCPARLDILEKNLIEGTYRFRRRSSTNARYYSTVTMSIR